MISGLSSLLSYISTTCCLHNTILSCDIKNHNYDDDLKTISTCSATLTFSESCYPSRRRQTMVHRQRRQAKKVNNYTTMSPNRDGSSSQLVKAVSPFDELIPRMKTFLQDDDLDDDVAAVFPFDEILVPKTTPRYRFEEDALQRQQPQLVQHPQTRHEEALESREPVDDRCRREGISSSSMEIPVIISISESFEDESEVSCEVVSEASPSRTLTPHPSFDGPKKNNTMTANDFHYLYQASKKQEEQDWPSDEDGPPLSEEGEWFEECDKITSRMVCKNGTTWMILNDLDETLSRRDSLSPAEHCEI